MSLAGILSSNLFQFNTQGTYDRMQQFRQDFQKLGQDLQTGNLTGAQADFGAAERRAAVEFVDAEQQSDRAGVSATEHRSAIGQPDHGAAGLSEPGGFAHAAFASSPSFRRRRGEQPDVANPVSTGAGPAVG